MNTDKKHVWIRLLLLLSALVLPAAAGAEAPEVPGTKSGFVTTADGVKIHYIEAGRGPAMLFVPGWTMPGWIWEHQIAHFSKSHRVVAMDPRSQGESSKPAEGHYSAARARDIKAVVDNLKLKPVVLVGWSMGVMEIAAYVDQFGTADLAGIVLVDGIAGADFDPQASPQFLQWAGSFLVDRPKATDAFVRSMYKQPQSEDYLQRVIAASLKTPTNSAGALLLAYVTSDYRPALAKFDKPTLVIVAPSPWLPQFEKMSQLVPGARFVVVEDANHALFVDKPADFNSALADFLKGVTMPAVSH